jgi:restriction system protein
MARYRPMYEIEVTHSGLSKYRHIRGTDRRVVQQKADALRAQWDDEWRRRQGVAATRRTRESLRLAKDTARQEAIDLSLEAQGKLLEVQSLLQHALAVDNRVPWEEFKDQARFSEPGPDKPRIVARPSPPYEGAAKYLPAWSITWLFSKKAKQAAFARMATKLEADRLAHSQLVTALDNKHEEEGAEYDAAVARWNEQRDAFLEKQHEQHREIDDRRLAVEAGDEGALIDLVDLVLSRSSYPEFMNPDYAIDFAHETGGLVLDYELPSPDAMPSLKEVKFSPTSGEFTEKQISEAEKARLFDSAMFQIALRSLHEVFEADENQHIKRITFNGWVAFIDRATGADRRSCIMSIGVNRDDFLAIDLSRVDPKECFKALKGVSASKLFALAPVPPLQRPREHDTRLIDGEDVASGLESGVNVAAMDWKDFEHLVRQIFEAQFATPGSEVKVTQASRDGGVDAIVFDPDPIRGGKIVIQAKRYINTVDVSSVRDLYGTVMNEGATKGILVTTSQYGPDAYKFAQGKPLTLIDGGNLLHLLGQIGVQARIDLEEARGLQRQG